MEVYDLVERDVYLVIAGYSDEVRARIVDRWIELEMLVRNPNKAKNAARAAERWSITSTLIVGRRQTKLARLSHQKITRNCVTTTSWLRYRKCLKKQLLIF